MALSGNGANDDNRLTQWPSVSFMALSSSNLLITCVMYSYVRANPMWKLKEVLQESLLPFYQVNPPGDETLAISSAAACVFTP